VVFDTPCLYPNLTVRQMLEHARLVCGRRARPPAELEALLGLERFRAVKIRRLSLGNRRRAAIAHALAGRPTLVILDEPFSGLDAGGVDDLITLILGQNGRDGTTFLLASHQLPYLERICTHLGILHGGIIARGGTISDLVAERTARLWLRVNRSAGARGLLADRPDVVSVAEEPDGRLVLEVNEADPAAINRDLVAAGFDVAELVCRPPTLESLFREVVEGAA
jgi:ABC-2 type transport system ATP-binding protein